VATAILDRCGTWRSNPVLSAIQRYLVEKALGRWLDYQSLGLEPQGDIVGIYFDGSNLACSSIPSDWRIFTAGWPNALNVPGTSALSPERGQYKFYGDV
jgi:hypothetical protein